MYAASILDYLNMGKRAYGERNYSEAIQNYEKAAELFKRSGEKGGYATVLNIMGMAYYAWSHYDQAMESYRKALAINEELGKTEYIAMIVVNIGQVYYAWGQYDKALEYYGKALAIYEKLGQKSSIAICLNHIGMVYKSWGNYDLAIENYRKSLAIQEELGNKSMMGVCLYNIAEVYLAWGQFDRVVEYLRKNLAINEELGNKNNIASALNGIGMVYKEWGHYEKALEHYRNALAIYKELERKDHIAITLINIGEAFRALGQYEKALENYRKSLTTEEELGRKEGVATALNNMGLVYAARADYNLAMENYLKALDMAEEMGQKALKATILGGIGGVYYNLGRYDKALEYYNKSLSINEELGQKSSLALNMNNIGVIYYGKGEYSKSIPYFEKAVALKDEMCITAKGDIRRDYLASQIYTYQFLADSHFHSGSFRSSFNAVEAANCKYLVEQMQGKLGTVLETFDVEKYQRIIPIHTAVVSFANMEQDDSLVFAVDSKSLYGAEIKKKEFISAISHRFETSIMKVSERTRGIKIKEKASGKEQSALIEREKKDKPAFDRIIDYYRYLLSKSDLSKEEEAARKQIAGELYRLLFSGIDKNLIGKNDLVIIPGGVLAFVPFESLIMPDGHYLAERFNIKYTQSLTVSEIIKKREYDPDRKPVLAFGGAVYDEGKYATEMITTEVQLKSALLALNRGSDARVTYAGLGYSWSNLPGTLAEVKAIKTIIKDADIYTGSKVTKSSFSEMSKKGELRNYKVIHLATHGLVVPEAPELSAVVFSQFIIPKQGDDGYLRAGEILDLDLKADFVNLSACEAGLGKLYSGEGIVGLTQSFLVAGANGLSVSLWQVADESTTEFMVGLYKLVKGKGLSYDKAMTEMRRQFIRNPKWSSPYFWSPFLYYGGS
jgi:tetratricopeptide (TPR) repeat protein